MHLNARVEKDSAHHFRPARPTRAHERRLFCAFSDGVNGLAPPICTYEAEVGLLVTRLPATLDAMSDLKG